MLAQQSEESGMGPAHDQTLFGGATYLSPSRRRPPVCAASATRRSVRCIGAEILPRASPQPAQLRCVAHAAMKRGASRKQVCALVRDTTRGKSSSARISQRSRLRPTSGRSRGRPSGSDQPRRFADHRDVRFGHTGEIDAGGGRRCRTDFPQTWHGDARMRVGVVRCAQESRVNASASTSASAAATNAAMLMTPWRNADA